MKEIDLQVGFSAELKIDLSAVDHKKTNELGQVLLGTMELLPMKEEIEIARKNGAQVVWAALEIEKAMEQLISHHLFHPIGINPSRDFFHKDILTSSFFGFAPKKMLVQKIINEQELLSGKGKNRLSGALKQVSDKRNAFAHGNITARQGQGCLLQYFSGDQKSDQLSDEYWSELEKNVLDAKALLKEAVERLLFKFIPPPDAEVDSK
jgi:hypothetical protein